MVAELAYTVSGLGVVSSREWEEVLEESAINTGIVVCVNLA